MTPAPFSINLIFRGFLHVPRKGYPAKGKFPFSLSMNHSQLLRTLDCRRLLNPGGLCPGR